MKVVEMMTSNRGLTMSDEMFSIKSRFKQEDSLDLPPFTRLVCPLIPIPSGYRMLTEEEKAKYDRNDIIDHVMFYSYSSGNFVQCYGDDNWDDDFIYVIREDWKPEPKVEVTITINGKAVDPSTISKEAWNNLRNGGVE